MKDITEKVSLLKATRNVPANCTEPIIPEISKLSNEKRNRSILYAEPDYAYHRVYDTTEYPYISTCKLEIDGRENVGSGFMVGPNLMLTAAHCLFAEDNSIRPWYAYPAYNDGMYENYKSGWQVIHTPQIWLDAHEKNPNNVPEAYAKYDWSLIELDWDMGYGVGCYGCEAYTQSNSELNGVETRLVGYPLSIDWAKHQYFIDSKIFGTQDLFFYCAHANREGMSGGPIMRYSSKYALGIIKGNKSNENMEYTYGVRISQYIIDLILSLRTD